MFDLFTAWHINSNLSSCGDTDILTLNDNCVTLSRSCCSSAISDVCDMDFMILVSSAKLRIKVTHWVVSLIKITNRMGPSTVP